MFLHEFGHVCLLIHSLVKISSCSFRCALPLFGNNFFTHFVSHDLIFLSHYLLLHLLRTLCFCQSLFVCLSVCVLARQLKKL